MFKCKVCNCIKPKTEFSINLIKPTLSDPNKIYYKKTCKPCRAKIWKKERETYNYKPSQAQKEKNNKAQRERDKERKKLLTEMLGGKCVSCGTTENLQFDHIDPTTKSFSIGKRYRCKDVFEEIKKCQLLCCDCHWKKTSEDYKQKKILKKRRPIDSN